ncbi:MAG: DinB family protein [Nocardioides sp.]
MERTDPPLVADEATTLRSYLDYHRDTLRWKAGGLTQEQLATRLAPSTMTLGGIMKHMSLVEEGWFSRTLLGNEYTERWGAVDWQSDPDWEWRTAADDSPETLRAVFDAACAHSDRCIEQALADDGLDTRSARSSQREDSPFSLRWIMVHMIEEYARHNGHADLIRESIDGETGE